MTPIHYAKKICFSTEETLMFTLEMAMKYRYAQGDFVEAGVAAGAQIMAMRYGAPNKVIHAFDSFQGIPLPSNRDDQMPGIMMLTPTEQKMLPGPGLQMLQTTGATAVSVEEFKQHIKMAALSMDNIIIHEGWFEETVPDNDIKEISLLRLDGDLYNSTWVCLQHLFPKVIPGGCVIIDDWELPGSRAACEEYFQLIGYTPEYQSVSNIKYLIK